MTLSSASPTTLSVPVCAENDAVTASNLRDSSDSNPVPTAAAPIATLWPTKATLGATGAENQLGVWPNLSGEPSQDGRQSDEEYDQADEPAKHAAKREQPSKQPV